MVRAPAYRYVEYQAHIFYLDAFLNGILALLLQVLQEVLVSKAEKVHSEVDLNVILLESLHLLRVEVLEQGVETLVCCIFSKLDDLFGGLSHGAV